MSQSSQSTARHDPRADSAEEDDLRTRHPDNRQRIRLPQPVGRPDGDGGDNPDAPGEGEFELIGDNDLGAADLGPAAPDPDADSGRIRKIRPEHL
jgi:hypothetical protein